MVSLNEIAQEVYNLLEPQARQSQVNLIRVFDYSLPPVSLDPQGIHHALLNLVTNALDACHLDGQSKEHHVIIKTGRQDNLMILEVSDNG